MKKIVFITRHDPTKTGGGAFATRAYLEVINKLYPKQVVLFVADSYEDGILSFESSKIIKVPSRTRVNAILGILTGKLTRFDKVIKNWLKSNKDNIHAVIFDGSIIGGSFINLLKKYHCKLVTIHHNYEVEYHKENKSVETLKGRFLFWIQKLERNTYLQSHTNLFLTKLDLELFKKTYGHNKALNSVIGCFEFFKNNNQDIAYTKQYTNNLKFVISGSLATHQTEDGVHWFLDYFYPKLKAIYPNAELIITGRAPSTRVIEKCNKLRVTLIPSPENIKSVIVTGDVYICPTRLGGGLKLRIMDALALGLPCLIQEKSFRGYENIGKLNFIKSFKNNSDFFESLNNLLINIDLKQDAINKKIKKKYYKEFSFESGYSRMQKILNESNI